MLLQCFNCSECSWFRLSSMLHGQALKGHQRLVEQRHSRLFSVAIATPAV
jgi:hypothetical protein